MENNNIFRRVKDRKIPTHYTIRESLVTKIKAVSKEQQISESMVVDLIVEDYFNNH